MPTVLGLDLSADFAAIFKGQLFRGTFTKITSGAYDPLDPAGPPDETALVYSADGMAFSYGERYVDGEQIKKGDYSVMFLLGTIGLADTAIAAELELADHTLNGDSIFAAVTAGAQGNAIQISLVAGVAAALVEDVDEKTVEITFVDGITTVADVELLVATSTLIEVDTTGTPGSVLVASLDEFIGQAMTGGADDELAPGIVPNPGDLVSIPPPSSETPATARVITIEAINLAQVTCQVRGVGA